MLRQSLAFRNFLDFSSAIDDETRKKLVAITETHPVLQNHPLMKRLAKTEPAFISISAITRINEEILKHNVTLAKTAASGDQNTCFRAIMEQNVLTNASVALNSLMIEHFQGKINRLSKVLDTLNVNEAEVNHA